MAGRMLIYLKGRKDEKSLGATKAKETQIRTGQGHPARLLMRSHGRSQYALAVQEFQVFERKDCLGNILL